jgi:two-component system sensor histidine kinase ChiS
VAKELARSQQKIQAMQATFDTLKDHINQEARHLVDELDVIDQTTVDIFAQLSANEIEFLLRQTIVEMMNNALSCWSESAGKGKIELAEESGIWRAYLDNGTYKTRTLDKYLDIDKLPKKPRINDVLQTVEFVSRHCDQNRACLKPLQSAHTKLMAILKAKSAKMV